MSITAAATLAAPIIKKALLSGTQKAAVGSALDFAGKALPTVAAAIPGRMERMYKQDVLADRRRLQGPTRTDQRAIAEGMGVVQAQEEQAMSKALRGSASDAGASGAQAGMVGDIQKGAMGAGNQVVSTTRQQQIEADRADRRDLAGRMQGAYQQRNARVAATLAAYKGAGIAGKEAGEEDRALEAAKVLQTMPS